MVGTVGGEGFESPLFHGFSHFKGSSSPAVKLASRIARGDTLAIHKVLS